MPPNETMSILTRVHSASGYIASQLVKQLLERGYTVRGTVRSLADPKKTSHLRALPGSDRLHLFEADLMREGSFDEAVSTCEGVFHTASPFFFNGVTDPEQQLLQPAVKGTTNVLGSCAKAGSVKRVVLTSSMASVGVNGNTLPKDHVYTEADWSKEDVMREKGIWYPLSKTLAERAAWDFVKTQTAFDLVVINPCLVAGPILQPTLNTSSEMVLAYLDGTKTKIANSAMGFVDVRDVAVNHILAMETPSAHGRYVCESYSALWTEVAEILREVEPGNARIPTEVEEGEPATATKFSNEKATQLGVDFKPLREILKSTVEGLRAQGFLKE